MGENKMGAMCDVSTRPLKSMWSKSRAANDTSFFTITEKAPTSALLRNYDKPAPKNGKCLKCESPSLVGAFNRDRVNRWIVCSSI